MLSEYKYKEFINYFYKTNKIILNKLYNSLIFKLIIFYYFCCMIEIQRDYLLLLSDKPCEIFDYFKVDELHGLNKKDCLNHINNRKQAYIAGWCNLIPNSDKYFVFINLSRCNGLILTTGLVFHELMHYSLAHHNYNMELEEEIITYAETETYEVVKLIYQFI